MGVAVGSESREQGTAARTASEEWVMGLQRRSFSDSPNYSPPGTPERRSVCRYPVSIDSAWLGWWEGQVFRSSPAKIIDISLRGVRLHVKKIPAKVETTWFGPPGVTPQSQEEWLEARVVGIRKRFLGPREVRLTFRKPFPYETFKTVVYGPDLFHPYEPAQWLPEEAEERDWW